MRKLREILRLHHESRVSGRAIGQSCRLSPSTVQDYLHRAKVAGLGWPLPDDLDDLGLERLLFPHEHEVVHRKCAEPDWALIHLELKKKHVTKMLLWQEYREQHADGYQYSHFCERYRAWEGTLSVTMRQTHRAGEKVFIDFSGDGVNLVDPRTGECRTAKLFIAVLGASNYTYVEPVLSEDLPTWIGCNRRALEYFGGVPEIAVPDNLRSGVTRADFYDPDVNRAYADFAQHYHLAVIPARVRKPRDKAKVEQGVLLAERWILAALRNRQFSTLSELQAAVEPLRERLNAKPMRKINKSRREMFESVDRPALRALPSTAFELCDWRKARVNIDYHVEFDSHYYSVHFTHGQRRRDVEIRATATTVEIFWAGRRIASHVRSFEKWKHTTLVDHMPDAHRHSIDWPPSRIAAWAQSVGPMTGQVVEEIMRRRAHPQQGYRACLGLIRLRDTYDDARLEQACSYAVKHRTFSYRSVQAILKNNRDRLLSVDEEATDPPSLPGHGNIRGPRYYQ